jgi:hypothetical protein
MAKAGDGPTMGTDDVAEGSIGQNGKRERMKREEKRRGAPFGRRRTAELKVRGNYFGTDTKPTFSTIF